MSMNTKAFMENTCTLSHNLLKMNLSSLASSRWNKAFSPAEEGVGRAGSGGAIMEFRNFCFDLFFSISNDLIISPWVV